MVCLSLSEEIFGGRSEPQAPGESDPASSMSSSLHFHNSPWASTLLQSILESLFLSGFLICLEFYEYNLVGLGLSRLLQLYEGLLSKCPHRHAWKRDKKTQMCLSLQNSKAYDSDLLCNQELIINKLYWSTIKFNIGYKSNGTVKYRC